MVPPLPKKGEDSGGATTGEGLWSHLPRSWRGYDRAATEALLGELVSKHAELERDCGKLREQAAKLEADLTRHRRQAQLMRKTLSEATSHATSIREKAREDAELILRKARAEQEKRAALAERERADSEREVVRLRKFAQELQHRLASFLTQTLEQLHPESPTPVGEAPPAGDVQGALVTALEAALKPDGGPAGGQVAPLRQSSSRPAGAEP
jgi:hypothetical protein